MILGRLTLVLLIVPFSQAAFSQTALAGKPDAGESAPGWVLLIDPVCPVSFSARPLPNATKEMRVLYFPAAKEAKLKNPESLSLNAGFGAPRLPNRPIHADSAAIPFARKEEHWEAIIPLDKHHAAYAIFSVQDDKSGAVDDNNGQFWDVVFCNAIGQKGAFGVMFQAQGYAGGTWSAKLSRTKDYNKAISVIEAYQAQNPSHAGLGLISDLWQYKVERDGGDAQAYAKLAKEIGQYLADHPNDKAVAGPVGSFVIQHEEKLPAEFVERTISDLDARRNDPKHSLRANLAYSRAMKEADPRKRLTAVDDFIAKYPESSEVEFAEESRLYTFIELKDVPGAEAALSRYRDARAREKDGFDPNAYNPYLTLARLYIDKGVKLDAALKLADEAQQAADSIVEHREIKLPPEIKSQVEAECDEIRARAYVGLRKPDSAVSHAEKALLVFKDSAEAHFVLAQAYGAAGDKQKALDQYFEAALMPSNSDLEYRAELERYYRKNFGNAKQFQVVLNKRISDRFLASHYVPKLIDDPAPALAFTTLKGEKFDAGSLSRKTVVINFWSPG